MQQSDIRNFFILPELPVKRRKLDGGVSKEKDTSETAVAQKPASGHNDYIHAQEDALRKPTRLPEEFRFAGQRLDIGKANVQKLSKQERYEFLTSFWTPPEDYNFNPVWQAKRPRFPQRSWLTENPTLAYSHVEQGFFCTTCSVFCDVLLNHIYKNWKNGPQSFVNVPYRRYKDFKEDYKKHVATKYHLYLSEKALEFQQSYNSGDDVITLQFAGYDKMVAKNRTHITILSKVLYLSAVLELPLRGTHDSGPISSKIDAEKGVFRGILSFLVKNGLPEAAVLIDNPGNAQYTSPAIQNDLLKCISTVMLDPVLDRIRASKVITLMLDETSSHSTEYLSIVIRTVDDSCMIQEDFLGFLELQEQTAVKIYEAATNRLKEFGIDMAMIVAQGYDGAATMSGCRGGVQSLLRERFPEALFFHCAAHKLNLVVTDATKRYHPEVRTAMGHFTNIFSYFHQSTKAAAALKASVESMKDELGSTRKHLPSLCDTRWVERHDSFVALKLLMPAIVDCLGNLDGETRADALQSVVEQQFKVYVVLILMEDVAQVMKRPAELLQKSQIELLDAFELIKEVITLLKGRKNGSHFERHYKEGVSLAKKCNCPISAKVGRKTITRPAAVKAHYKKLFQSVYSTVLDEMMIRFGNAQHTMVLGLFSLVPGLKGNDLMIEEASQFYRRFLPSPDTIAVELQTWKQFTSKCDNKPTSVIETLRLYTGIRQTHPNVHRLLQIAATLPVSTAAVERSFSALARILTDLRSSMTTYRLTDLAVISYYATPVEPDYDKILAEFKRMKPRRIEI